MRSKKRGRVKDWALLDLNQALARIMKGLLTEQDLTETKAAKVFGLSQTTINRITHEGSGVRLSSVSKIIRPLEESPCEFFCRDSVIANFEHDHMNRPKEELYDTLRLLLGRRELEMLVGTVQDHMRAGRLKEFMKTIAALRDHANP